jgi:2,3-diketo-5-methylthio-1-phosphopentane phosphatase
MHNIRLSKLSDCLVFFDFDNTITPFDVLDDIIERFSVNKDWVTYEQAWKKGEIGSRVCLQKQMRSVRITRRELLSYLSGIRIDPHFRELFDMLIREGIKPVILSDNFSFIVNFILANNGIKGAKVYANALKFSQNRLMPSFPYTNKHCLRCAHCKKKNLLKKEVQDKIIMYIGDGMSDVCPAQYAHIVFAKGSLLEYFRRQKRLCVAFRNPEDIYTYFRGLER